MTDHLGHDVDVRGISIRLGAPAYPYDTLHLSGEVVAVADGVVELRVTGAVSLGDHVVGTVRVAVAEVSA